MMGTAERGNLGASARDRGSALSLWDRGGHRYLLDQLLADTGSGHNITQSVFIECGSMYRAEGPAEMKPVGEIEFVNGTSAMSASGQFGKSRLCAGIVGHADLRLGDGVARVLEPEIAAGDGRFGGIRHPVVWDASENVLARSHELVAAPDGRCDLAGRVCSAGAAEPDLRGLVVPSSADGVGRFGARVPTDDDHSEPCRRTARDPACNADKKEETFSVWRAGIAELGKCQIVVVKLGGLGMLFGMFDFHTRETPPSSEELARAYKPYLETCIAPFGPDRGMFESNFPPDGVSSSYAVLWNAFKRLAAGYSPEDKAKLFSGTAKRVYRLAQIAVAVVAPADAIAVMNLACRFVAKCPAGAEPVRPTLGNCRLAPVTWSPRAPNGGKKCGGYEGCVASRLACGHK